MHRPWRSACSSGRESFSSAIQSPRRSWNRPSLASTQELPRSCTQIENPPFHSCTLPSRDTPTHPAWPRRLGHRQAAAAARGPPTVFVPCSTSLCQNGNRFAATGGGYQENWRRVVRNPTESASEKLPKGLFPVSISHLLQCGPRSPGATVNGMNPISPPSHSESVTYTASPRGLEAEAAGAAAAARGPRTGAARRPPQAAQRRGAVRRTFEEIDAGRRRPPPTPDSGATSAAAASSWRTLAGGQAQVGLPQAGLAGPGEQHPPVGRVDARHCDVVDGGQRAPGLGHCGHRGAAAAGRRRHRQSPASGHPRPARTAPARPRHRDCPAAPPAHSPALLHRGRGAVPPLAQHQQRRLSGDQSGGFRDSGRRPSIRRNDSGRLRSLHHRPKSPERSEVNTNCWPSGAITGRRSRPEDGNNRST